MQGSTINSLLDFRYMAQRMRQSSLDSSHSLSSLLAERREDSIGTPNEIKQGEVAKLIRMSQGTVSLAERNADEDLPKRSPSFVLNFLRGYRFNDEEIRKLARRFNLSLPFAFLQNMEFIEAEDEGEPIGEVVAIPVVGEIGAGFDVEVDSDTYIEPLKVATSFLEGSKPENCRIRVVTGSSMVCSEVRKRIPEGSKVIYDVSLTPQNRDIVLARVWHGDIPQLVLKVLFRDRDWIELRSYNDEYPPIILLEGMRCDILGVYINHLGVGRQAMRRNL